MMGMAIVMEASHFVTPSSMTVDNEDGEEEEAITLGGIGIILFGSDLLGIFFTTQ